MSTVELFGIQKKKKYIYIYMQPPIEYFSLSTFWSMTERASDILIRSLLVTYQLEAYIF